MTIYPDHATVGEQLIQQADAALYRAKHLGATAQKWQSRHRHCYQLGISQLERWTFVRVADTACTASGHRKHS